jgi:hypothetical protein
VILKYIAYVFTLFVVLIILGLLIKPVKVSDIDIATYKDPFLMAREAYAKAVWHEFAKQSDINKKFIVIQRVLSYSPSFKQAYDELCKDTDLYRASDISIRDFLKLLKNGAETFEDIYFTNCYVSTLTGMQRYIEALSFLNQRYAQESNIEMQETIMDMIRTVQNEKNMLDLAKAVETYYQKYKTYPGDILVLVNEGFIDRIPEEPYGGQYFISLQGQIKTTSEMMKNE